MSRANVKLRIVMDTPNLPFYVIGHLNPDTDAICSAIGHAALLRATGEQPNASAARCGVVPKRTEWVLEKAGIETPPLIEDVRATAGMICRRNVVEASESDTFMEAYNSMLSHGVRSVPVTNEQGEVSGILRYLDLLELLLPGDGSDLAARTVNVSLERVAATLSAESVGADLPCDGVSEDLIVLVGASSQKTVDRRLRVAGKEGAVGRYLVVCGDRPVVQHYAIDHGVRALLVTGGNDVEPNLRELARERGVVVLRCSQDTATSTTLIRSSRSVSQVMQGGFEVISADEPVSLLRKSLAALDQDLFPVNDPVSGKMIGVITKTDLVDPPRMQVALVDHNEFAQAVRGVDEAHVVEVIDHHRLAGDLISREPIRFLNEPVGSTSTLVGRKFHHRMLKPDAGVAMCLCAGIISDTLCLTSPTTTELDRQMLTWLSNIAEVDPETFKGEFFAVGSLLAGGSAEEVIHADRKEFEDAGVRITIAQIEELGLGKFDERRDELKQALQAFAEDKGFDLAVLAVTDIASHHSMILAVGDARFVAGLPFEQVDEGHFSAPGVVSRKKQIFPAVCQAIRRMV